MLFKGIVLVLLTFIFGLSTLIVLIIAIYKRKNKSVRNKCIIATFVCLAISLSSFMYLIVKGVPILIEKAENVGDASISFLGEVLSGRHPDSPFMDSIKALQPKDASIPNPYFYCAGFRDYYRMPLIYPYSIIAIDGLEYGSIDNEKDIKDVFVSSNDGKQIVGNITEFVFDRNLLLAKTESQSDSIPQIGYLLLHFESGNIDKFDSLSKMKIRSNALGFDTIRPMISIKEYYRFF